MTQKEPPGIASGGSLRRLARREPAADDEDEGFTTILLADFVLSRL